ncbi:hypothetical protein FRC10_006169 [Ceratobasidium sp. 414]|nr:hypothetical protein FRC10_006169 [Ceratobasidium sp. 414]
MADLFGGRSTVAVKQIPNLSGSLYALAAKGKDKLPRMLYPLIDRTASAIYIHEVRVAHIRRKTPPGCDVEKYARKGYEDALSRLIEWVKEPPPCLFEVVQYAPWIKFCKDLYFYLNYMLDVVKLQPLTFTPDSLHTDPAMITLLLDIKNLI